MLILSCEGYAGGLAPCQQANCAVFLNGQSVLSTDLLAFFIMCMLCRWTGLLSVSFMSTTL